MAHRLSRPIPTVPDGAFLAGQVYQLYDDLNNKVVPYLQNRDAYDLSTIGVDLYVVFDLQTCQFVRWVRGARRERLGEPGCCAGLHRLGV